MKHLSSREQGKTLLEVSELALGSLGLVATPLFLPPVQLPRLAILVYNDSQTLWPKRKGN